MEDCWHILGLDFLNVTEKEVKAAYARLLKVHRPEADPDAFQRVRTAYKAAVSALKRSPVTEEPVEEVQHGADNHAPGECPAPLSSANRDVEVNKAIDHLREATSTRIRQRVREALVTFDELSTKRQIPHAEQTQWLCDAFAAAPNLLAEMCGVDRLLRHMEAGDSTLAHEVLKLWKQEGDTKRLQELACVLLRRGTLAANELGAGVFLHAAIMLGPWEPATANELSRTAFPHLPVASRAELTAAADREIMLGQVFSGFPKNHKIFWLGYVQGTGLRTNWRDSWSRELLGFLLRNCGPKWPGYSVLEQTMPRDVWDGMLRAMRMLSGQ